MSVLWEPSADARRTTRLGQWMSSIEDAHHVAFGCYADAWQWSIDNLDAFWRSIADMVAWRDEPRVMLERAVMPGARWCPGATLNYAANVVAAAPADAAVVAHSHTRGPIELSGDDLRRQIAAAQAGLVAAGIAPGDRVAAYLPNIPEALVAFLACAGLGVIWSSCPPEFGAKGVIDRFAQIEPKLLLAVTGYVHRGKAVDKSADLAAIRAALPTLETTVIVPYGEEQVTGAVDWATFTDDAGAFTAEPVAFDHPLYVLYSSGTTGLPKPIVHCHGGILLEHRKIHALHHDMGPGDRFFWFSTTGWMMWNYLVSGLASGASIVLFDGDPAWPDLNALWDLAAETGITHFGASAPFLLSCRKAGLDPQSTADLSSVREVGSTGAPLPAEGFEWVYEHVGSSLRLASVSGGTDMCTAFVGGVPIDPVRAGRIGGACLGAAVAAFDDEGRPVRNQQGNLVITKPMPSMPVGFWGDPDGSRYRAAYFERYPGVWDHGDWITIADDGTCVITGRSDSTLNRGGVRLGTSEFYSVVEAMPEVVDSLVVHIEDPSGGPGRLLLFVQTVEPLGAALEDAIKTRLRTELSPRHVPDAIEAVPRIPRTLSGKKLEIPVKRILSGMAPEQAASKDALTDPHALAPFVAIARRDAAYH